MAKKPKTGPRTATAGDKAIGERIRFYRVAKKLNQTDLGDHLGISFQMIQKMERGINRCGADRLTRIAAYLGVTTNDLLGVDGDSPAMNGETAELLTFMGRPMNARMIRSCMKLTPAQLGKLADLIETM